MGYTSILLPHIKKTKNLSEHLCFLQHMIDKLSCIRFNNSLCSFLETYAFNWKAEWEKGGRKEIFHSLSCFSNALFRRYLTLSFIENMHIIAVDNFITKKCLLYSNRLLHCPTVSVFSTKKKRQSLNLDGQFLHIHSWTMEGFEPTVVSSVLK